MNNEHESTYTLLVRSEEKSRDVLETAVYLMCILSRSSRSGSLWRNQASFLSVAWHRGHIPPFISRSTLWNRIPDAES
jgi:hypothetical protein